MNPAQLGTVALAISSTAYVDLYGPSPMGVVTGSDRLRMLLIGGGADAVNQQLRSIC